MSFFRYSEQHGDVLISLDDIRCVKQIRANPAGGSPRQDEGVILYSDGTTVEVSANCAEAIQSTLKSRTVPQRDQSR